MRNDIEIELLKKNPLIIYTMRHSKNICNIEAIGKKGDKYIKYPKLCELHNKLFNTEPNNLHNSFIDVIVCLKCFYMLFFGKDICLINRNIQALYRKYCYIYIYMWIYIFNYLFNIMVYITNFL